MSLIELLVYIGIIAAFVVSISYLVFSVDSVAQKSSAWTEVNGNNRYVSAKITNILRTADSISIPSSTILKATKGETTYQFYLLNGVLKMTVDGEERPLTSSRVNVTEFTFKNISIISKRESYSISYTIEYQNPGGKPELAIKQNNRITVTLRQ